MWKPRWGSEDDEKALVFIRTLRFWIKKTILASVLETSTLSTPLFTAAVRGGDLPAAVKRAVESVDVYKTSAIIILFVNLEARWLGSGTVQ